MIDKRLHYHFHDESDVLRLELAGSLRGAGAEGVYREWKRWCSLVDDHSLIIDITFVVDADERGCAVLDAWHRGGARIIAASPESQALAMAVLGGHGLGEPSPIEHTPNSWFQRLSEFVLACPSVLPLCTDSRRTNNPSRL